MAYHIHCSRCLEPIYREGAVFFERWVVTLCRQCAAEVFKELENELALRSLREGGVE